MYIHIWHQSPGIVKQILPEATIILVSATSSAIAQ